MQELLQNLEYVEQFKTGFIMIVLCMAIAALFRLYKKEQEKYREDVKDFADRMETASEKFNGVSEKMLENQIEQIKAQNELAKSMEMQAKATAALGSIIEDGFNDLTKKLIDTKEQIVAHIDIKNEQNRG